jgi:uncharacterized protein
MVRKKRIWPYVMIGFSTGTLLITIIFSAIITIPIQPAYAFRDWKYSSVAEYSVPIIGVSTRDRIGEVGTLKVRPLDDTDQIFINIHPFSTPDIQYSSQVASQVAHELIDLKSEFKGFLIDYDMDTVLLGGPSAGAATTVAKYAALTEKQIKKGVAITGTINPDGTIGRVQDIFEKTFAASEAGFHTMLIPDGQSKIVMTPYKTGDSITYQFDFVEFAKKEWNIDVIEVSNINQVLDYMID